MIWETKIFPVGKLPKGWEPFGVLFDSVVAKRAGNTPSIYELRFKSGAGLSARAIHVMERASVTDLDKFLKLDLHPFIKRANCGSKTLDELKNLQAELKSKENK